MFPPLAVDPMNSMPDNAVREFEHARSLPVAIGNIRQRRRATVGAIAGLCKDKRR